MLDSSQSMQPKRAGNLSCPLVSPKSVHGNEFGCSQAFHSPAYSHFARPEIILDLICPAVECLSPIVHVNEILPIGVALPAGNVNVGHVIDAPNGPVDRLL